MEPKQILFERMQEIFDLKDPIEESKRKLYGTHMIVNGNLELIVSFNFPKNVVVVFNKKTSRNKNIICKSISVWLPETGLYPLEKGNCLLITRLPKRRWNSSFHIDLYKLKFIYRNDTIPSVEFSLAQASKTKRVDIYVDLDKTIWFRDMIIGHVENKDTFICVNKNYTQELIDWNIKCH